MSIMADLVHLERFRGKAWSSIYFQYPVEDILVRQQHILLSMNNHHPSSLSLSEVALLDN